MSDDPTLPLARRLLHDQRRRWQRGERVPAESYLGEHPALSGDREAVLDLVYQEVMLRRERGEVVDAGEFLGRFPDLADELRTQFEVDAVIDSGTLLSAQPTPAAVPQPPPRPETGYELLGELGRGGMGVVYKARQPGLNRTVALKMIRAGAGARAEDLTRFRVEAEAAARLTHPNIVQIFEVGERDGCPFLALEYVDGGNLAERLAGSPLPPTEAARLLETLADAMQYAHERGIVHRDLKPANVLLEAHGLRPVGPVGERSHGTQPVGVGAQPVGVGAQPVGFSWIPKITDFGLAKLLAEGPSQTQTGDFLGTPAYTAPEQAAGRLREIGPATDTYALGAILYECLTGRPPFHAVTPLETLLQLRTLDPVPPRRLQPGVPRDLETICLKCLRKEPAKRYPTARALAEDLRRFRDGRPILARPVGNGERLVLWARRRPALAALAALTGLLVLGLAVGGWWSSAALGAAARRESRQRERAEENLTQALDAVERMLTQVGAVELADVPQMDPVRKRLLVDAQDFYRRFLAERGEDPGVRYLAGRAACRLGETHLTLDEHDDALRACGWAVELLSGSDDAGARRELARTHNNLGLLFKKLGNLGAAERSLRTALGLRRVPAEGTPAALLRELAESHHDLGTVLARVPNRREEAEDAYREALAIQDRLAAEFPAPEHERDRARTLKNWGVLLQRADPVRAGTQFRRAVTILRELAAGQPAVPSHRRELAGNCNNLAVVLWQGGRGAEAREAYGEARTLLERLALDFPTVPAYQQELAAVHNNLGMLLEEGGELREAEALYRGALAVRRRLAEEHPEVPDHARRLAAVRLSLGSVLEKAGRTGEAEREYRDACATLGAVAAAHPGRAEYRGELGVALNHLASLLFRRGRLGDAREQLGLVLVRQPLDGVAYFARATAALVEARDCLLRAEAEQRSAWEADRRNDAARRALRDHCFSLAEVQLALGNAAGAARAAAVLPELFPDEAGEHVTAAEFLARSVPLAGAAAEEHARRAVALLAEAVRKGFRGGEELRTVPAYAPLRQRPDFQNLLRDLESLRAVAG